MHCLSLKDLKYIPILHVTVQTETPTNLKFHGNASAFPRTSKETNNKDNHGMIRFLK